MASSRVLGSGLQRGQVESPEPVQLWEQQPGEGPRAYAAFLEYRNLGQNRTYSQTARNLKKSVPVIAQWGKKWRWQERINAWVRHQENEKHAAMLRSIVETNERHTSISRMFQQKIVERLRMMKAEEIAAKDIPRWLEAAVEVERMALGLGGGKTTNITAIQQIGVTRPEGDMLTDATRGLAPVDRDLVRSLGLKFVQLLKLEAEEKTGEVIDVRDGEAENLMVVGAIECSIYDDSAKVQALLDATAEAYAARTPPSSLSSFESGWSPEGAPDEPLAGYQLSWGETESDT